ncbi:AAA family ATPase [Tuwongella immobilis]|uniref:ATPase AAA-type core domain-containing protein n=1 Tax=Tuwongella immobilis TaxID=692036 RepID=A0A6C2YLM2_9BACT
MSCETNRQWAVMDGGKFQPCGATTAALPAGAYSCFLDPYGQPYFMQKPLLVDELIDFPGSLPNRILHELDQFWTLGERFAKYGFLHRRGFLFWGKQGCGKSSLIHQITSKVIASGHVAFFCQYPRAFVACMEKFRQVEPERPIVCIFEDIDAIIQHHGDSDLLQWLDGNTQVNKAVNLASTNYPEKLDRRIIARPRRFDRILQIETPDESMRRAYFLAKLPELSPVEMERWVLLTESLPFAALAEVIISVCCLGNSLEETVKRLKDQDAALPNSAEYQNSDESGDDDYEDSDEYANSVN